jgi:hypothetical protein
MVRAHRELRANRASELTVLDLFAHPLVRGLAAHVVESAVKTVAVSTVDRWCRAAASAPGRLLAG